MIRLAIAPVIARLIAFVLLAVVAAAPQAEAAGSDRATVLILDASGSMWGELPEGRTKIEVARDVLSGFLASRDGSVPLGVIAYGHNRKGDCGDIELIAPVGVQDGGALATRLSKIAPKGKTPLGQSLRMAAGAIPPTAEEADIVLVTDGLETCGVSPCMVAEELAAAGIRIRAHVVGFGLTEDEVDTLACVPDRTGGLLLRAEDGTALAEALARTTAEVDTPAAGPVPMATIRDRGPYAAIGEAAVIDVRVTQAGLEQGGAALALRLYGMGGDGAAGEPITYSTLDGAEGVKEAAITLPAAPGRYLLRLETWAGEPLAELVMETEADPAVMLQAPPSVAPGSPIALDITGSQLRNDSIEIWKGEAQIDWGRYLHEYAAGQPLLAPAEPGTYDLVYKGYDAGGERVEKARVAIDVGVVNDDATGAATTAVAGDPDDGHGPDGETDGTPWTDYAYHCLKAKPCDVTDAGTGLTFRLPAGWVATEPSVTPMTVGPAEAGVKNPLPHVEFYEAGGNLSTIVLNPHQWLESNGFCQATRAGPRCMFRSASRPDDDPAYAAFAQLQVSLTTGTVTRRCGMDADCTFAHPDPAIAGTMPWSWSVERGRRLDDGQIATWFFDRDPAGNFKLIGLNQPDGENCSPSALGQLCEFTPYISTEEFELIRSTLRGG